MGEGDKILALKPDDVAGPTPLPAAVTADDARWLTLCVYQEARGEPIDGKAAVAKVVLNRTRRDPPFCSDGTVKGTVFWPNQFSWTSWAFVSGHYIKVARTSAEVAARADQLYVQSIADRAVWEACSGVALDVLGGTYQGGAAYQQLGPDALLYVNLAVSHPAWAEPDKHVARIGAHDFYRP